MKHCALCGREFAQLTVWFSQEVMQEEHKFTVISKLESDIPRDARLCPPCSCKVITDAAGRLQIRIAELQAVVQARKARMG